MDVVSEIQSEGMSRCARHKNEKSNAKAWGLRCQREPHANRSQSDLAQRTDLRVDLLLDFYV